MTNPLAEFGISDDDIAQAIAEDPAINAGINDFMENTVVPTWQANYPQDTGAGRDSIQVTKPAQGGKGQAGALDEAANIIEYGSEDTEEFAPRAKTESQLGGTPA